MNINLIYPELPTPVAHLFPDSQVTEQKVLRILSSQIEFQFRQFAKDIPSATIRTITASIETLLKKLPALERKQPASSNLNVILTLGASVQDGQWHSASGWEVRYQSTSPESERLAGLYIRQALRILGRSAISNQTAVISQRSVSTARLLDVTATPTILTTNLYIDNRANASLLRSVSGIRSLARIHAEALKQYLELSQ